jgi:hypothetical protein
VPVVACIVAVMLVFFAYRVGVNAGNALWLPVVLAAIGAIALALHLWHRRQLHRIHELYSVELGNYYRMSMVRDWPKYCGQCGVSVHSWKQVRAHDNEITSPCMRLRHYLDSLERPAESLPMEGFTAEVLGPPPQQQAEPWRPAVPPPTDDAPALKA